MDGSTFFEAVLAAKPGCTITDKISKSGKANKPGIMTLKFSDGTSVSFARAEAVKLKTEEQLASFIRGLF